MNKQELIAEHGSIRKAAKVLGIPRSTLRRQLDDGSFLSEQGAALGFDPSDVSCYWLKTDSASILIKKDTEVDYPDLRQEFLDFAKRKAPKYKKIRHEKGEHLLVVDPADVHFGKLAIAIETGGEYNLKIAEERMASGVSGLLSKSLPHGVSKIVLVLGNDILHVDTPHRTTTSGTGQDTDGMWWEAYNAAKRSYIQTIERLTQIADVHLLHCPSNHDFKSGWMLADSVGSHFHNHPNVISDLGSMSIAHRKYIQFGSSLLGFTHGDGSKEQDLPSLMQYEARKAWGDTRFGYWYVHHMHHKQRKLYGKTKMNIEKDHIGVTVIQSGKERDLCNSISTEIIRSPSESDRWHSTNGYVNEAAMECFLHHPEKGQVARFTEFF